MERYISLAIEEGNRSVIITGGYIGGQFGETAQKMARLINVPEMEKQTPSARSPKPKAFYIETIRSNKWSTISPIKDKSSSVIIQGGSEVSEEDVLQRCIICKFQVPLAVNTYIKWISSDGFAVYGILHSQFIRNE
uniref:Putative ovule protein n=1 Tax=Solanum chacoense TaxID=4108 RepID=A0A0V0HQS9_SOLCH